MQPLSSIRQARLFSTSPLLQRFNTFNCLSRASSNRSGFLGCLKSFTSGAQYADDVRNLGKNLDQQTGKENVSTADASPFRDYTRPLGLTDFGSGRNVGNLERNFDQQSVKDNVSTGYASAYQDYNRPLGPSPTDFGLGRNVRNVERNFDLQTAKENFSSTYASPFRNYIHPAGQSQTDFGSGSNFRSMDFVREAIDAGERRGNFRGSQSRQDNFEQNEHFAHIKLMRNNTFVVVTDANGNKKCGASAGVPGLLGAAKVSKYAAEAVAEYAGRKARRIGIKSVVVRVKGFCHFKKKKQAILSFREGFKNPIVFIEDVTRHPHNGCRLPKKRRI